MFAKLFNRRKLTVNSPAEATVWAEKQHRTNLFQAGLNFKVIENLPEGVSVRRVHPKASGNLWAAQYRKGPVYYGKTVNEAIDELFRVQPAVAERFTHNVIESAMLQKHGVRTAPDIEHPQPKPKEEEPEE